MFSTFREYFDRKTVAAIGTGGAIALGCGVYAVAGALIGWGFGFKVGSTGWFAALFGWPALPLVILGLGFGVFGRGPFGHDLGDWKGDRYDY